ncbi:hypothetical protein DPMN_041584 [Dreissena polymorpha]|uniref:Uncharacterized protein n=1 Tax=Dreissena polymorpha TaxID=45954 RepID=A0A9D4CXH6_DREPO|nr:hypothetical protein DPMN_041584 [Dreissena polymorpha]
MTAILVGPHEPVNRQNLAWFGHVTRNESLCKAVLHGHARGKSTSMPSEEQLDGQCETLIFSSHGRNILSSTQQTWLKVDFCNVVPYFPPTARPVKGMTMILLMCFVVSDCMMC